MQEVTRLFTAYAENSALESVSLKAAMIMPTLLLQKPHQRSKPKEFSSHLEHRLKLWLEGNLEELLNESHTIQQRTCRIHQNSNQPQQETARIFAKLMMQGKVKKTLRLIGSETKGGPLQLNDRVEPEMPETVRDVLTKKHPPKQHPKPSAIITSETPPSEPHPILYEKINGQLIHKIAPKMEGAAGPSGLDAAAWKRLCSSFKTASSDLCTAIASIARKLCTQYVTVHAERDHNSQF